jgi:hypothetical protein
MEATIKASTERHRKEMQSYLTQLNDFDKENGGMYRTCDYYTHRREMMQYHRGAVNALLELRV